MSNTSSSASGGIGFFGLLCIAFIVLKLCNVISWSWWLVFLPLYGPIALVLAILVIVGLIWLLALVAKALIKLVRPKKKPITRR